MDEKKKVVIILNQYSVVVKGIEKKLDQLGYNVEILMHEPEKLEKMVLTTDLFLIYIPSDIMDDQDKQKDLSDICLTLRKYAQKMIALGEPKYHTELLDAVPLLNNFGWLDRPIDNHTLGVAVIKAIAGMGMAGFKKRILIVDDDSSYASMVKEWIKDMYKTDIVTTGMQAITFLLKNPVDMVLLDYEMPVMDGPQVLQVLRQEAVTKDIPVVFLTGVGTKEEVARVMELKPNGYILKSTTRENLLEYLKGKLG